MSILRLDSFEALQVLRRGGHSSNHARANVDIADAASQKTLWAAIDLLWDAGCEIASALLVEVAEKEHIERPKRVEASENSQENPPIQP